MKSHTQNFLRQRKFYIMLPVLIVPFVTMLFWILGGGRGTVQAQTKTFGLNVHLPDARFDKRETWNKLSLYEAAARDSANFRQARDNDPYFDLMAFETSHSFQEKENKGPGNLIQQFPQKQKTSADPNEVKVNQKLNELYREINKANRQSTETQQEQSSVIESKPISDPQFTEDVDRLEKVMEMMNKSGTEADPEMQRIEGVLDKILDIQHPDRLKKRENDNALPSNTMTVRKARPENVVSELSHPERFRDQLTIADSFNDSITQPFSHLAVVQNGFFGLDDEQTRNEQSSNAIEAVIHDTQELVAGATVKMRVVQDIEIKGIKIPKDELIYGTCTINGERLSIAVNSIRSGKSILPVSLEVYDLDGLEGIYIPGAITRDAAKKASDDALQSIRLMSLDPSLEAQAAGAGLEAVKGLFSKKAKLIKVTVKAGYRLLLVDSNTQF